MVSSGAGRGAAAGRHVDIPRGAATPRLPRPERPVKVPVPTERFPRREENGLEKVDRTPLKRASLFGRAFGGGAKKDDPRQRMHKRQPSSRYLDNKGLARETLVSHDA